MNLVEHFLTKNACYIAGVNFAPSGIMVHSTGANNPNISRYVAPGKWDVFHPGGTDIGPHPYKDSNGDGKCDLCGGRQVCVHAFIGEQTDGTIATCQTLPLNRRGWHAGGSANDTHIGFEICEGDLNDAGYFNKVYPEAVEFCAYLCRTFVIKPSNIICHSEGHAKGIASNHSDVMHWFPKHGKTMDDFRADVAAKLAPVEKKRMQVVNVPAGDALNIRDRPANAGVVIGKLQPGQTVEVSENVNGWLAVNGGWAWGGYLAPAPKEPETYTVVRFDTLRGIGRKLSIDWHRIADANGILGPKYTIRTGQVLKIPEA
jgi:hypothetical protein